MIVTFVLTPADLARIGRLHPEVCPETTVRRAARDAVADLMRRVEAHERTQELAARGEIEIGRAG